MGNVDKRHADSLPSGVENPVEIMTMPLSQARRFSQPQLRALEAMVKDNDPGPGFCHMCGQGKGQDASGNDGLQKRRRGELRGGNHACVTEGDKPSGSTHTCSIIHLAHGLRQSANRTTHTDKFSE